MAEAVGGRSRRAWTVEGEAAASSSEVAGTMRGGRGCSSSSSGARCVGCRRRDLLSSWDGQSRRTTTAHTPSPTQPILSSLTQTWATKPPHVHLSLHSPLCQPPPQSPVSSAIAVQPSSFSFDFRPTSPLNRRIASATSNCLSIVSPRPCLPCGLNGSSALPEPLIHVAAFPFSASCPSHWLSSTAVILVALRSSAWKQVRGERYKTNTRFGDPAVPLNHPLG
ncbi:hypothetical protein PIB30_048609 [Stylosanthes scabra]|uniref:Uncharacterized protein n=1 Tax=Stylosanthes scabra TaxID=79078 RepID=A0ABU6RHT5_9FABA|nr:hypothetical protein [Stylosanthes scabra]